MSKIGIAVEGESDRVILEEILKKLNVDIDNYDIKLPPAHSGGKDILYKKMREMVKFFDHETIIFLVDYDDSEKDEEKFRKRIEEIQKQNPRKKIYLRFARQEIESWLLGCYEESLKEAKNENPDNIKDPKALIEKYEKKKRRDDKFKYNEITDGRKIASVNQLNHFRHSASFKEFENLLN